MAFWKDMLILQKGEVSQLQIDPIILRNLYPFEIYVTYTTGMQLR